MSDMQMIFGNPCERVIQLRTTDLNYRDLGLCGCKNMVLGREQEASIQAHSTPKAPQIWPCWFPPLFPHLQSGSISSTRSIRKLQWEQSSPSISARFLEQVLQPCLPFHACSKVGFQGCIWSEVWPAVLLWPMKGQMWHMLEARAWLMAVLCPFLPPGRQLRNKGQDGMGWGELSSLYGPVLGATKIWHALTVILLPLLIPRIMFLAKHRETGFDLRWRQMAINFKL